MNEVDDKNANLLGGMTIVALVSFTTDDIDAAYPWSRPNYARQVGDLRISYMRVQVRPLMLETITGIRPRENMHVRA